MKKIHELKKERAELVEGMRSIIEVCEKEKRTKSEDEGKRFDNLEEKIEGLNSQIEEAERMEQYNKYLLESEDAGESKEKAKMVKRYDLSKAILEQPSGGLSGVEREIQEIGRRMWNDAGIITKGLIIPDFMYTGKRANEETSTTLAAQIPTSVAPLDITAAPSMYQKLGCTIYNLTAKTSIPFSKGHTATKVTEEGAASQSVDTKASGTLEANRYQGWQLFSNESLAQSAVVADILKDMIQSLDRAISLDLLTQAVAANVLTGFATTDTAAALTYKNALKLLSGLETETFDSPAFVMAKPIYHDAEGIEKVTSSGRFIIENGVLNGEKAYASSQMLVHDTNKYDVVYGDWSRGYVGLFSGGMELLIDPFTASDNGRTKITFSRLGDVVVNGHRFASLRNVKTS